MHTPDVLNGVFEALGAVMIWINVRRLMRDKEIKGVYWPVWIIYTLWGFWNLYYYPALDQWISFIAGTAVVSGNFVWVVLAMKYTRHRFDDVPPAEMAPVIYPPPKVPDFASPESCQHTSFDNQFLCRGCGACALDLQEAGGLPYQKKKKATRKTRAKKRPLR